MSKQSYQTQIEKLKEQGLYGSRKDPYFDPESGTHKCCGSPRAYYHRAGCPLCVGRVQKESEPEKNKIMKWSNLLKNICPSCNRDLIKTMVATDDQSIACKCGFKISQQKYREITADRVSDSIEESYEDNGEENIEG